jgi:hypothetical protein
VLDPTTLLRSGRQGEIVDAVVRWSEEFIEQPHEIFGGLPICPFARAARLKQAIRFEVRPFALDDPLEPRGELLTWCASSRRRRRTGHSRPCSSSTQTGGSRCRVCSTSWPD